MTDVSSQSIFLDNDKMEAVSSIVGTIAHDFNNLLMPLLAYPELIKSDLPEGASGRELLDVIEKTSKDMVHITEQLLNLSAKDIGGGKGAVDVNSLVSIVLSQLTRKGLIPEGITVQTKLASDLSPVLGSPDHLVLAVQNICLNAVEAIGGTGNLDVLTENVTVAEGTTAAGFSHGQGAFVKISVADSGTGIPDAIKSLVFDPFFTTKKSRNRRGAGLGLSVACKVVMRHGGYLDFDSKPGQGTTFDIYLPVGGSSKVEKTEVVASREVEANIVKDQVKCDSCRVLLVDDEKTILKLFQMILSSGIDGSTIDVACNGDEGVKAFSEHHHSVIVMDLHMPVMDGQAAFLKIEQLCKEHSWQMPSVVFCTGFAPPELINEVVDKNPRHCLLAKPVGGDSLVEAVKSRLGK